MSELSQTICNMSEKMTNQNKHLGSVLRNVALESVDDKPKVIVSSLGSLVTQALNVAYDKKAETTEKTDEQVLQDKVATESQAIDHQLALVKQSNSEQPSDVVYYQYNPVIGTASSEQPSASSVMNQLSAVDEDLVPKEIIYYVDGTETGLVGDASPTPGGYSKDELKTLAVESISVIVKLKKN